MAAYILVFDKKKAPNNSKDFANWFEKKSKWDEERDYYDIKGTSKNLTDFFLEITKEYPNELPEDEEQQKMCVDYIIGSDLIYMSCPWSIADAFWNKVEELAQKYDLGYSDLEKIYWDKNNATPFEFSNDQKKQEKKAKPKEIVSKLLTIICTIALISIIVSIITLFITKNNTASHSITVSMIIFMISAAVQENLKK